jgi:hypothetical protein
MLTQAGAPKAPNTKSPFCHTKGWAPYGQETASPKKEGEISFCSVLRTNILNMDFRILDSKYHVLASFLVTPNGKVPVFPSSVETHNYMRKAEAIVAHKLWRSRRGVLHIWAL